MGIHVTILLVHKIFRLFPFLNKFKLLNYFDLINSPCNLRKLEP